MEQFVRDLITTLVSGGLYVLMSSGVVLTYATTRIFNLGYAGVAYAAAYVFFELNTGAGWPAWAAAVFVCFVMCPLIGLFLDVAIFRKLAHASEAAQLVANVGVLLAVPALAITVVDIGRGQFNWNIPQGDTVSQVTGPGPQPATTFHLFSGVGITSDQIFVLAVAVVVIIGLAIFLRWSKTGLRLRALSDGRELASLRGVNEARMSQLAWVIGTVLAGAAGVVGAPLLHSLTPDVYTFALFVAICGAVLGRFQSVFWAAAGVLLISLISDVIVSYWTWASNVPGFSDSVPFLFLVIGLIVVGQRRGRIAGSVAADPPPPDYHADLPWWRKSIPGAIGAAAIIIWVFFVLNSYWDGLAVQGLIYALIFLSITIITGIGGMVSLAQATFVAGGGLVAGMLIQKYGIPWIPALLLAVVIVMILGVLVALPSLRLNGVAVALSTLALAFIGSNLLFQLNWLSNGNQGWMLGTPTFGPINLSDPKWMAGLVLVLMAIVLVVIRNLQRSATGRQMLAVRNSEPGAIAVGVSPTVTKLKLFALSAGIAALGGVLLATTQVSFTSGSITTLSGLLWLAVVVLCGVRRPAGAIIGGLSIGLVPNLLSGGFTLPFGIASWAGTQDSQIPTLLFALGAVFLARQPDGFMQDYAKRNYERRQRRRLRKAAAAGEQAPALEPVNGQPLVSAQPSPNGQPLAAAQPSPNGQSPALAGVGDHHLSVAGVTSGYGAVTIVRDLTLQLSRGGVLALLGPNGAGKSTTCKTIAGLLPVTGGQIHIDGTDVTAQPSWLRSRNGVFLAPEGRGIFPSLSVDDNLKLLLSDPADRELIYERFDNLKQRKRVPAGNLSGGEQQMLALAPVLSTVPAVLIVDEPTLGLAPRVANQVLNLFRDAERPDSVIILAGESPRGLTDIADRVALLHAGRVVWSGTAEELDTQTLEQAYFSEGRI